MVKESPLNKFTREAHRSNSYCSCAASEQIRGLGELIYMLEEEEAKKSAIRGQAMDVGGGCL